MRVNTQWATRERVLLAFFVFSVVFLLISVIVLGVGIHDMHREVLAQHPKALDRKSTSSIQEEALHLVSTVVLAKSITDLPWKDAYIDPHNNETEAFTRNLTAKVAANTPRRFSSKPPLPL